jgi:hypothetical protein
LDQDDLADARDLTIKARGEIALLHPLLGIAQQDRAAKAAMAAASLAQPTQIVGFHIAATSR